MPNATPEVKEMKETTKVTTPSQITTKLQILQILVELNSRFVELRQLLLKPHSKYKYIIHNAN